MNAKPSATPAFEGDQGSIYLPISLAPEAPAREGHAVKSRSRFYGIFPWTHKSFRRKHRVLFGSLLAVTVLAGVAIFLAAVVGWSCYQEATVYDPGIVAEFQRGGMVLDSAGEMIGSLAGDGRILVRRDEIPDHLVAALMAAEDTRFYDHVGFDPIGIARAALVNFRKKGVVQGGSTITQQLARNSFDLGGRNLHRKIVELFVAMRVENAFTKDEIVTHYFNRVYFGSGFYGIGAAANGYFGKPVSDLTVAESAMMCGLIRSPNALSPFLNPDAAEAGKERVLNRMVSEGLVDRDAAEDSSFRIAGVIGNDGRNNRPRFLLTLIRREARLLMADRPIHGIIVETSLNSDLQKYGESVLAEKLTRIESGEGRDYPHPTRADYQAGRLSEPDYLQGAAVVIENGTGRILSAIGSRDSFESDYDRVTLSRRSAGTAFIPFVYAAAYESGAATPFTEVFDAPIDNREVMLGGVEGILGEWGMESSGFHYLGRIPSGYALIAGKNAATVRLGFQTGLEKVEAVARLAGIRSDLPDFPSAFLGAGEVSLLELTHAYTTFPNKGWKTGRAGLIDRITSRDGEVIYERTTAAFPSERAFSELTASRIRVLLSQAVGERVDSETSAQLGSLTSKVGGMTGTSSGSDNNWFIGFNDLYTWGIWVGMDIPQPIYENAFARDTALPIWSQLAVSLDLPEQIDEGKPVADVVPVCVDSCSLAHIGCRERGHRIIGLPRGGQSDSPAYCRKDQSRADLSRAARTAEVRAKPLIRATPVGFKSGGKTYTDAFQPVASDTPPLAGEDVFGVLDQWMGR